MGTGGDRQDEIDTAAAAWAARLGGDPLSDAERRDLDRWLGEASAHRTAFEEARSAWDEMGRLRFAPGALRDDIVPLPAGARVSPLPTLGRRRARWPRVAAVAACLLVLVGGLAFWAGDPVVLVTADYRTAPGEQRLVALSDGSTVALGPASAIAVDYGQSTREVRLLAGLAYFTVAPAGGGEHRPFVVAAARGTARALGTRFMVERLAEEVEITVAEHTVEVALAGPTGVRSTVIVAPGQSVRYGGAGLGAVHKVNVERATAWRRGRLIFDDVPLGEVVAALNRYRHGRILIADRDLASRKVSGVFETEASDAALATVVRDLRISVASLPPLVTVLY
ncbi:sensor [Allostella vacuolata]|nr:sensor [Stella vacuolata]